MPTYEYRCVAGHAFEVFQRMSDDPVDVCPECGKDVERLLSGGAGLIFKGDGFYITETRSEDYKKKQSAESAANAKSADSGPADTPKSSTDSSRSSTDSSSSATPSTKKAPESAKPGKD